MTIGTHTKTSTCRLKGKHCEELLPGIPNDITLDLIAPKLPWKALFVLSCVSRCWEEAIRTKRVYEGRLRANSTETLIVHSHVHNDGEALALYSTREKCCCELPPIPCLPKGTLKSCEFVAAGGKLYVLGGRQSVREQRVLEGRRVVLDVCSTEFISREVYVLDLAGLLGKWEPCASMLHSRCRFDCGALDGKIYVFGGEKYMDTYSELTTSLCPSEVYDTEKNAWSRVMPMTQFISGPKYAAVARVENELFLHNRSFLGVYNPAKNDWRLVKHFWKVNDPSLFTTNGKFYMLSGSGIDVYDAKKNLWLNRHRNSFATVLPSDPSKLYPLDVLAIKDELALTTEPIIEGVCHLLSFRCTGFDRERKELVWQKTNFSFRSYTLGTTHCSIQL